MKIVLGVTGGIAAYKAADITSKLAQRGDEVQVVLTKGAQRFVTALTFESISGRAVVHDLWQPPPDHRPIHITTAAWADVLVVAPATANFIGKVAGGIADDALTSTVMAARCPVVIAPAMNDAMWENPLVQENVKRLEGVGYTIVPPGEGWLADGYSGVGRLAPGRRTHAGQRVGPGRPAIRRPVVGAAIPMGRHEVPHHRRPHARAPRPGAIPRQRIQRQDGLRPRP